MAEKMRFPTVLSQALNTKSLILAASNRPEEALILLRHALQIALQNDLAEAALRAYNNIGAMMNERDLHEDELASTVEGLELARKFGNRPWEEAMLIGRLTPFLFLGRWDDMKAVTEEARQLGMDPFNRLFGGELALLAAVDVWRGDIAEARANLETLNFATEEDVQLRVTWHGMNALVCRAEGKFQEAITSAELALEGRVELGVRAPSTKDGFVQLVEAALDTDDMGLAEKTLDLVRALGPGEVTPYMDAQFRRFEGRIAALQGGDPSPGLREAIRIFKELAMPFWDAVASLEHAEWLLAQGRDGEAAPLIEQARATFAKLRATPWLERLERSGALESLAQAT
jgi:tetratricopeptide (TPR) repeat protein